MRVETLHGASGKQRSLRERWRAGEFLCLVLAVLFCFLGESPRCDAAEDVESLIGQLATRETAVHLSGYYSYGSALEFLPLDASLEPQAPPKEHDRPVLDLIRLGVEAVPALVAHLDDDRPTRIEPQRVDGFSEFLDWNRRSKVDVPFWGEKPLSTAEAQSKRITQYRLTVGDLCYEVLGQIVNRDYYCSYSFGCFASGINSPGQSPLMRIHVKKTWAGLTRERHRELLIADFREADCANRRLGAYIRLAFYYPESVEDVVVEELARPHYSEEEVDTFCRQTLLVEPDRARRQQLVTEFVLSHNEAGEYGLQCALKMPFRLFTWELLQNQSGRAVADDVLLDTYQVAAIDDAYNVIPNVYATTKERLNLIQNLTLDHSSVVGNAVTAILARDPSDVDAVPACLRCLANRGRPGILIRHLKCVDRRAAVAVPLHLAVLEACATSREKTVRDWLRNFALTTTNGDYFVASLDAVEDAECTLILERAEALLSTLPADAPDGQRILSTVTSRFPNGALSLAVSYLKGGDPSRIASVCDDLSSSTDPRILLLEPFLSDRRETQQSLTVRDVVAHAIAGTIEGMEYQTGAPPEMRDAVIEELKQHCDRLRKETLEPHDPAVAD